VRAFCIDTVVEVALFHVQLLSFSPACSAGFAGSRNRRSVAAGKVQLFGRFPVLGTVEIFNVTH
jgi:hypothetical protein